MKLNNNGYLVKALSNSPYEPFISISKNYKGIGVFFSWPLSDKVDAISKTIENEASEKYFNYEEAVFWLIPDKKFLLLYMNHCKKLGMETLILRVETKLENQQADDELEVSEVLGFDLADNVDFSYLAYDMGCLNNPTISELKVFEQSKLKLNKNGLFDTYEDAVDHLEIRNKIVEQGIDIEHSDSEIYPLRLSIVKL